MTEQPRDVELLLDVPEEKEVLFGFDHYAATLASAILSTEPHFTIGIYGDWGRGKTTLLRKIGSELNSRGRQQVVTVFFEAWRYQREEHMLLPLLDTLRERLKGMEGVWSTLKTDLGGLVNAFAAAIRITPIPQVRIDLDKAIEQWREDDKARSVYYGWLEELQGALGRFRSGDPSRRIIVLIDDLDRCLPGKAVEVLESIKVMLDVSGFVFVLALNQQITEKAVESHYPREYGISGRDYLKKLVQVEFHLPPLRLQDVQEYALALQVKLGQTSGEVQRLLAQVTPLVAGDNPREVKRFINRTLVSTAIAQEAGVKVPIARQIAFMTASYRWPAFVEELRGEQDPRRDIGDYLKAKERGKALEDEGKRSRIEALLKQHEGLEFFLKEAPGSGLLLAKREELVQMLFYAALTQEKAPERPGRLSRDEVLAAVAEHRPLVGADLAGIDLSGAILIGADLRRSDLSMAILREAILSGADLRGANLTGANLTGAILTGAFLRGANLTGAILIRAFLTGAFLTGAFLTGAFLTGAFLTGAFLTEADLTGAFLREADLTEADLTEADLTRANLAGARGLMPEQAGKAIYDESTVWPEGFKPERGAG